MGLSIGEVAKRAGVKVETVRFYERKGLIPEPPRLASGYRHYQPEAVRRIQFIRHAKDLGFSLGEISELLSLRLHPETPCSEVQGRARAKVADIDGKIRTLQRMKRTLEELSDRCTGSGPLEECPILEALDRED